MQETPHPDPALSDKGMSVKAKTGDESEAPRREAEPQVAIVRAEETRNVWWALLMLVATGLAISLWLLAFTDHLIIFSSLVALTGFFAWAASLGNILTDERKKALQRDIEARLLNRPEKIAVACGIVWLILLTLPFLGGTVVLQAEGNSDSRLFRILPDAPQPFRMLLTSEGLIRPFEKRKVFLWKFVDYTIKISGIPPKPAVLPTPWHRTYEQIPQSFFRRPVVLLRPEKAVYDRIQEKIEAGASLRLDIRRPLDGQSKQLVPAPYLGQAVWLDGDLDLELPGRLDTQWRQELGLSGDGGRVPWLPALVAQAAPLSKGERIRVELVNDKTDGLNSSPLCFTVDPSPRWETFPQVEVLRLSTGKDEPCL